MIRGTVNTNNRRWDTDLLEWVPHTGALAAVIGDVVIGTVKQGLGGASSWKTDGSATTQPVSAASLPLPTGAATETTLAAVNNKLPALESGRVPVVLPAGGSGLTDTELRATVVPVTLGALVSHVIVDSMPAGGAGLTDTELRATPVGVSGPLTDAQLRASAVPTSTATLPLPSGAATAANQLPDGHNVTVDNASLAITAAALPLPTGAATAALQGTNFGKTITYVPVAQGAAGTTQLAAASPGNRHKILGCVLTLSAEGSLKFLDGSGDLTGAMDIGATGGFVLPTSLIPYQVSATNSALSITTTVGTAKGVVVVLTEP